MSWIPHVCEDLNKIRWKRKGEDGQRKTGVDKKRSAQTLSLRQKDGCRCHLWMQRSNEVTVTWSHLLLCWFLVRNISESVWFQWSSQCKEADGWCLCMAGSWLCPTETSSQTKLSPIRIGYDKEEAVKAWPCSCSPSTYTPLHWLSTPREEGWCGGEGEQRGLSVCCLVESH